MNRITLIVLVRPASFYLISELAIHAFWLLSGDVLIGQMNLI